MKARQITRLLAVVVVLSSFLLNVGPSSAAPMLALEDFDIFLGRPTDHSVTINVIPTSDGFIKFEYGDESGVYGSQVGPVACIAGDPVEEVFESLSADTQYFYQMLFSTTGAEPWTAGEEHSFRTQRPPGSTFTFTIISDSHLGQYGGNTAYQLELYTQALANAGADLPDFHIDLGDTFPMDPSPLGTGMTVEEADEAYLFQRPYMGTIGHSVPIYLAIGNHENEEGWNFDDVFTAPDKSLAVVGIDARRKYYPNPIPDDFYTGNADVYVSPIDSSSGYHEDYYAWEWGDALFVVLDPYHYSMTWPNDFGQGYGGEGQDGEESGDRWDWTLGDQQYAWLKQTLENSDAKYKFVFTHQVTGGVTPYGRGGAAAAPYFEWGGSNWDDSWGFSSERPGWDMPIHQLMVANDVTVFFHGHDHAYARESLDGIVYQECPKPDADPDDPTQYTEEDGDDHYPDALVIESSGHVRVTVSPLMVKVEYVRVFLDGDDGTNGEIADSYVIPAEGVNIPPEAADDNVVTIQNIPVNVDVLANDVDYNPEDILVVESVSDPPNGAAEIQPDNTIDYTPDTDYIGQDSFTYDVSDGNGGTDTATVYVNVLDPSEGLAYVDDVGSATSKTSGTDLAIETTAAVAAGETIVVGYMSDPNSSLTLTVTDDAGNTYHEVANSICYGHGRAYIFAAYNAKTLPAGSHITIAGSQSVTARAAVASVFHGLFGADPLDQYLGNPVTGSEETRSGTTATVGPTGVTAQAAELLIGVIGTEGPLGDDAGSWDNSFTTGPRAGTTGDDADTNVTVSLGWRIVSATGAYTAQKSGITDRSWAAAIATFKGINAPQVDILGDVNGDDTVNSTEALIILSCDADLNTTEFCPMNCGDVNADGFITSTDALIVLSYDAGMGVEFPVGEEGCPSSVTQCAGCNP